MPKTPKVISPYNAARLATVPYVDPSLLDVPVQGYNITLRSFLPYLQQSYQDQRATIGGTVTLRTALPITSLAWVRYRVDKGLDKDINDLQTRLENLNAQNGYNKLRADDATAARSALSETGGGAAPSQSQPQAQFPVLLLLGGLAFVFRKKLRLA